MASEAGEPPQAGTPVVTPTLELQASDTPASDANEDTAAISPDATEPEERRGPFHRPFFVSLRGPHHSSTKNYLDREQQGEQSDRQTRLQEARTTVGRKSRLLFWKSSPAEEVAAAPKDPQKLLYMEAVSAYQNVRAAQQEAYNQMIEEQKYWKREGAPRQQARERRDITVARLTKEAQLRADEEALTREQTQTKLAEQAADMERRKRKKDEQTRRNRETQRQIREQIARERAEKEEEDRQKQIKDAELLAMQRKAKAESDAMKAEQEAKHTAHKEAEVMARFKASEEERTRRERETRERERLDIRKKEEAFRHKMHEQRRAEKAALHEREAAIKRYFASRRDASLRADHATKPRTGTQFFFSAD